MSDPAMPLAHPPHPPHPAYRPVGGPLYEPYPSPAHGENVGQQERYASMAVGALLVGGGLLRGGLGGLATAGLGALVLNRGATGHCPLYDKFGVNTATPSHPGTLGSGHGLTLPRQGGLRMRQAGRPDPTTLYESGLKIEQAVTVNKPADALYGYWRDLTNLPRFMPNVRQIEVLPDGKSRWHCTGPGGVAYRFDAETINDEPPHLLAWRSIESDASQNFGIAHTGSVRFLDAPGGHGTEVRINLEYLPPASFVGRFGAKVLHLFGQAPQDDTRHALRRFKQLMEAGEFATNRG